MSRASLEQSLARLGHRVYPARDGVEAWTLFERERPQVVITDWMMPRLDGLELCRRIRGDERYDRYTYLVGLTTPGSPRHDPEALNAACDDFLTQPFDPDELASRLRVAERILGMESKLATLEALHGCCEVCRRVRTTNGPWVILRPMARGATARPTPIRCPECIALDASQSRPVLAGVPNLR